MALPFSSRSREESSQDPPAPFIVGVARSGTTLLRLMLDAHSQLAIPPETHFVPKLIRKAEDGELTRAEIAEFVTTHRRWPDFGLDPGDFTRRLESVDPRDGGEVARCLYRAYAEQQGKLRWGDKSPPYVKRMPRLASALPEARFIHVIRDGRDVALSLVDVSWGPDTVGEGAAKWAEEIRRARKHAGRIGEERYMEIRYEDLISDPERHLRDVCSFVDLEFEPAMLDYHRSAAERMAGGELDLGGKGGTITAADRERQHALVSAPPSSERTRRWENEMSEADREAFDATAGKLWRKLGYG